MYKITKEPIFVDGKEDKALEMHARQRESIVFANTEGFSTLHNFRPHFG